MIHIINKLYVLLIPIHKIAANLKIKLPLKSKSMGFY